MEQLAISWEPARTTFTVSELNSLIRGMLGSEFDDIWVAGEISGCRVVASGHCYFTLKDEGAQIRCACFRNSLRYLKFKPQDGMSVLARGHVDVYEARGEYQLLVEGLEPQGHGALQFAFEQLKKKLALEGLFDPARKRALPPFPSRIGLITSPTGAVIQDILNVLSRRFPGLHLRLFPALVQGDGAVESVCQAIDYFSQSGWPNVLIVARGGGSLEDLWTFNEESVARAIARCQVPVISAIGHETDFTIADFVADLRAPTPSAAAELVIRTQAEVLEGIGVSRQKLLQAVRYRLAMSARRLHQLGVERSATLLHRKVGRGLQRVDEMEYSLRNGLAQLIVAKRRGLQHSTAKLESLDLRLRLAASRRRLDVAEALGAQRIQMRLARETARLDRLSAELTQLSPLKILDRGYAIIRDSAGTIVKSPAQVPPGTLIQARLADGSLRARVAEPISPNDAG